MIKESKNFEAKQVESLEEYEVRSIDAIDTYVKELEERSLEPQTMLYLTADKEPQRRGVETGNLKLDGLIHRMQAYFKSKDNYYGEEDESKFEDLRSYDELYPELFGVLIEESTTRDYAISWLFMRSKGADLEGPKFVVHIAERHYFSLEKVLLDENSFHLVGRIFEIIKKLLDGSPEQNRIANAFLKNNIRSIEKLIINHGNLLGTTNRAGFDPTTSWLVSRVEEWADPDIAEAIGILKNKAENALPSDFVSQPLFGQSKTSKKMLEEMQSSLVRHGLPKDLHLTWFVSSDMNPERLEEISRKNFSTILDLDSWRGGSAALLHREYGISDFGRYPLIMLQRQVEAHDEDVPYGLLAYAEADSTGALYRINSLESLSDQLASLSVTTRIVEVANTIALGRAFLALQKRYGENHKLKFAIIGGHGGRDSIYLGAAGEKGDLSTGTVNRLKTDNILRFFETDAPVVLFSCSTGAEEGLAEFFSQKTGLRTIAPDNDSGVEAITVEQKGDSLSFNVVFKKAGTSQFLKDEKI